MPETISETARWSKRAVRAPSTARGRFHYSHAFGDLSDNLILDLGSGKTRFRPENMVSFDYKYANKINDPHGDRNVAGLAQELPFRDHAFDRVVSSWLFLHIDNGKDQALSEALRVTKPGGTVEILPVSTFMSDDKELAENLERQGTTNASRPKPIATAIAAIGVAAWGDILLGDRITSGELGTTVTAVAIGAVAAAGILGFTHSSLDPKVLTINRHEVFDDPEVRTAAARDIISAYTL